MVFCNEQLCGARVVFRGATRSDEAERRSWGEAGLQNCGVRSGGPVPKEERK